MNEIDKQRISRLHLLTRRLIILTLIALVVFVSFFAYPFFYGGRLMISWLVFVCGIVGGFVSIQQRVKNISNEELELLCGSIWQVLLIPIFGAVFALVLYSVFLSGLLNSNMFPAFAIPQPSSSGPDTQFIIAVLRETYPQTGPDLAKLIFWCFVAGFAERFVPQIISNLTSKSDSNK